MSQYNVDPNKKEKLDPNKAPNAEIEEVFQVRRELKVQRQMARAEQMVTKQQRERSAGELALMFMGINQITQDQLSENPMTGYMNEIVFTRVIGHDDIEQGEYWTDSSQCWVWSRWNKIQIAYNPEDDRRIFHQKVEQIKSLHETI